MMTAPRSGFLMVHRVIIAIAKRLVGSCPPKRPCGGDFPSNNCADAQFVTFIFDVLAFAEFLDLLNLQKKIRPDPSYP